MNSRNQRESSVAMGNAGAPGLEFIEFVSFRTFRGKKLFKERSDCHESL